MSGGQEAQLAFYYQNIFTVYKMLTVLRSGQLQSLKIEQKVLGEEREVDVILKYNDGRVEYFEVKSGEAFTDNLTQIKEGIIALFKNYKRANNNQSEYWVIINPILAETIDLVISQLRRFKTYHILAPKFVIFCDSFGIDANRDERNKFLDFSHKLNIVAHLHTEELYAEVLREIMEISDGVFKNAEHALTREDLINRLVDELRKAIQNTKGEVDLNRIIDSIVDWCTRNSIASHNAPDQDRCNQEEDKIRAELQKKFPGMAVALPSPSPSEAISET